MCYPPLANQDTDKRKRVEFVNITLNIHLVFIHLGITSSFIFCSMLKGYWTGLGKMLVTHQHGLARSCFLLLHVNLPPHTALTVSYYLSSIPQMRRQPHWPDLNCIKRVCDMLSRRICIWNSRNMANSTPGEIGSCFQREYTGIRGKHIKK